MLSVTGVHAIPDGPVHMRGIINLRGSVLPVIDLRIRLGLPSAAKELDELLAIFDAREQDHKNWIAELDASIRERRPFALTTDPTKCAFGRWYGSLKTDNVVLATYLKRIDAPHREIHRRGAEAISLQAQGDSASAQAIAAHIREYSLKETLALFQDAKAALREAQREVAVVARGEQGRFAVVVDAVESVEQLRSQDVDEESRAVLASREPGLTAIGRRAKDDALVVVIDVKRLLHSEWPAVSAATDASQPA